MDPRTESIKQEVEETLEDMAAKMEQIEERVVGTARETVEQVKEKLDVRNMVAQRPWTMLGVSVAAGFLVGSIRRSGERSMRERDLDGWSRGQVSRRRARAFQYEHDDDPYQQIEDEELAPAMFRGMREHGGRRELVGRAARYRGERMDDEDEEYERPSRRLVQRSLSQVKQRAPGIMASIREQFGDDIEALKRAAVVTAGNALRGLMQQNLPQLAEEFDRARQESGIQRGHGGWRGEQQESEGRYGDEGRYGRYADEERYGRYADEGRYGRYDEERRGESRYGRYGVEGRTESEYEGQPRYAAEGSQAGSAVESEPIGGRTGGETYQAGAGATGRKSHN